jgi:ATP-dependent DNA helicase DinG
LGHRSSGLPAICAWPRQENARLALGQIDADPRIREPFHETLDALDTALSDFVEALESQAERAEELEQCHRRALELAQRLAAWRDDRIAASPCLRPSRPTMRKATRLPSLQTSQPVQPAQLGPETVRWVEVFSHTVQLHRTPLSIAPIFSRQRAGQPRAWVFTSATLSVKGNFTHYAAQLGLDRDRSLTLPSPFDYAKQGLLYVPGICHRRNRLNLPRRWWSGRCR